MEKVVFIHASDIHLGHQQFNLEQRFLDFGVAFSRVVAEAVDRKANFVLIGGDFFHKRAIDAETLKQAMELLGPLKEAGIPVIAIEGNHDKAFYQEKSSWLNLLNSLGYLRLLKPEYADGKLALLPWQEEGRTGSYTEVNDIRLIGLGYLGATTAQRLNEVAEQLETLEGRPFTILMLHAAVDKLLGQDLGGIKKELLEQFRDKVDYIALGHIHSRQEIGDWVFNPGALENCHIDEAKEGREKGFYCVTVQGAEKSVEYLNSTPRKVCFISVDVTGCQDPSEVRERMWTEINNCGVRDKEEPMVHILLRGEIDFSALAIDVSALTREVKTTTGCLYVEIQNHANLPREETGQQRSSALSRNEIEVQVLEQLVHRQCPEYREFHEDLVNLILGIKQAALEGEAASEIITEVKKLALRLPDTTENQEQVAVAREIARGGDNLETEEG